MISSNLREYLVIELLGRLFERMGPAAGLGRLLGVGLVIVVHVVGVGPSALDFGGCLVIRIVGILGGESSPPELSSRCPRSSSPCCSLSSD